MERTAMIPQGLFPLVSQVLLGAVFLGALAICFWIGVITLLQAIQTMDDMTAESPDDEQREKP